MSLKDEVCLSTALYMSPCRLTMSYRLASAHNACMALTGVAKVPADSTGQFASVVCRALRRLAGPSAHDTRAQTPV
jgi:hypothetical protein